MEYKQAGARSGPVGVAGRVRSACRWSRAALCGIVLGTAVVPGLGCGGSRSASTAALPGFRTRAGRDGRLARFLIRARTEERLASEQVPGGRVTILGGDYQAGKRSEFEMAEVEEEAKGPHGRYERGGGSSGGGALRRGEVLAMGVSGGCVAGREVLFAYGQLAQPRDSVIAKAHGLTVRLNKTTIPARLHPEGVLVYGLLPSGGANIVARAPSGAVQAVLPFRGTERVRCGGRPAG